MAEIGNVTPVQADISSLADLDRLHRDLRAWRSDYTESNRGRIHSTLSGAAYSLRGRRVPPRLSSDRILDDCVRAIHGARAGDAQPAQLAAQGDRRHGRAAVAPVETSGRCPPRFGALDALAGTGRDRRG